jgi:hypothetical protein
LVNINLFDENSKIQLLITFKQLDLAEQIYYLGKGVNMVNAINHATSHIEDRVDLNQEQVFLITLNYKIKYINTQVFINRL